MIDVPLTLSALSSAFTLLKQLNDIADNKTKPLVSELWDIVNTTKSDINGMADDIRNLKQELLDAVNWQEEKKDYKPYQITGGCFSYIRKSGGNSFVDNIHFCANCFENGKKSVLSVSQVGSIQFVIKCPNCNSSVQVTGSKYNKP